MSTYACGHPKTPENTVTVSGRWEYCRLCSRQAANRRHRARNPGAKQRAFLSLDDKLALYLRKTPDHWLWNGELRDGSIAVVDFDRKKIFVAQLLWEREHGPVPDRHCLFRTCTVASCVRPGCRQLALRGSHFTDQVRGVRGRKRAVPRIYGFTPEAAALLGLIDDAQYLAAYDRARWKRRRV